MIFLQILGGIAGASLASAVQCLAERYLYFGNGWLKSWVTGASRCDECSKVLKWYQLIPIASSLVALVGKTGCCAKEISPSYFIMEAIGASLGVLVTSQFIVQNYAGASLLILANLILFFSFITDTKGMHLNSYLLSAGATSVLLMQYFVGIDVHWVGALVGSGTFAILYIATFRKGIGSGDIFLGLLLGAAVGFPVIIPVLFFAFMIGAAVAIVLIAFKKKELGQKLPLGTFLILSYWIYLLVPGLSKLFLSLYGLQ